MKKILFVTNELYPVSRGGIGRLIHNYIIWNRSQPCPADMRVLMLDANRNKAWAGSHSEEIFIYNAETLGYLTKNQQTLLLNSGSSTHKEILDRSLLVANAIVRLAEDFAVAFDYIEFPDFMGLAYASIARKKEGHMAFSNTMLSVRLHSSLALIQADEGPNHYPSEYFAAVTDIERYCLLHADVVVGHLQPIVDLNRQLFGFTEAWGRRCYVEFPPIFLTEEEKQAACSYKESPTSVAERTFTFSSRLQPFKRPELFLHAASAYLRSSDTFYARFIIASYGWHEQYVSWLKSLIPEDLQKQIYFLSDVTAEERNRLLASSIIVIPSTLESLCLFAYESLLYGKCIILNKQCVAFGKVPFWKDGKNCILFDGTTAGLCDAMQRAVTMKVPEPTPFPATEPYWDHIQVPEREIYESYSLDILVPRISFGTPSPEDVDPYLVDGLVQHAFQFTDRLFTPRDAKILSDKETQRTIIDNYGVSLELGSLRQALIQSEASHIFLTTERSSPSPAWCQFVHSGLYAAADSDLVAFSTVDMSTGKRQKPLLDCPNLLSTNCNLRVLPVIVRKQLLLEALDTVRECDGWLVESLLIKLVFAGVQAHVLDLPVSIASPKTLYRFPLHHYTAHALSVERRSRIPHLAAYSGPPLRPAGFPYTDEWAVLQQPKQSQKGVKQSLMRAGVIVGQYSLTNTSFLPTGWCTEVKLLDVETDTISFKNITLSLILNANGLYIVFFSYLKRSNTTNVAENNHDCTPMEFCSWSAEIPQEFKDSPELGSALLHVVQFIADCLSVWCLTSYRRAGLSPKSVIEDRLLLLPEQVAARATAARRGLMQFVQQGAEQ